METVVVRSGEWIKTTLRLSLLHGRVKRFLTSYSVSSTRLKNTGMKGYKRINDSDPAHTSLSTFYDSRVPVDGPSRQRTNVPHKYSPSTSTALSVRTVCLDRLPTLCTLPSKSRPSY